MIKEIIFNQPSDSWVKSVGFPSARIRYDSIKQISWWSYFFVPSLADTSQHWHHPFLVNRTNKSHTEPTKDRQNMDMFAYTPQSVNDSIGITWFKRCQSSQRVGLEDVGIFIPWLKPRCMVLARCSARVADPSWTRGRGPRPMFKKSAAGVFFALHGQSNPKIDDVGRLEKNLAIVIYLYHPGKISCIFSWGEGWL